MDEQKRQQRRAAAAAWITEKWKGSRECPICGHTDWAAFTAYELREYEAGDLVVGVGNQVIPVNPLTCTTCGYMRLFNAFVTGAVPAPTPPDDANPPPTGKAGESS
jgi:hypothetical protein